MNSLEKWKGQNSESFWIMNMFCHLEGNTPSQVVEALHTLSHMVLQINWAWGEGHRKLNLQQVNQKYRSQLGLGIGIRRGQYCETAPAICGILQ
jgi:hypothetical protein